MLSDTGRTPTWILAPLLTVACTIAASGCARPDHTHRGFDWGASTAATTLTVVPYEQVDWGALNPARGTAGPRAADLWGDRTSTSATGFLVRFAEGFSSPPHIHNTTYRGVVIEGLVHNDDPGAEASWMPPGSYWTQPAGDVHITSASGEGRVAYIEIQHGPYLVMPPEEATDNGERAINIHAGNLVWLDASTARNIDLAPRTAAADGPRVAFLWGNPQDDQPGGSLVELPAGHTTLLESPGGSVQMVVVKGTPHLSSSDAQHGSALSPGSFVGASSERGIAVAWTSPERTWLYVRAAAPIQITSTPTN